MRALNVLVSGASVAGPALAYWLDRYGHAVTVVEKAPAPRPGGQAVDFKGTTHLTVLDRMGILDEVRRRQTGATDVVIVDGAGRPRATIPGEFSGGDVEIPRGELSRLLLDRTTDRCAYVFGDSVATLTETPTGVRVTFEQGPPRTFDLVIGADGIHSTVRRLAFGPEENYVRHLGHHYATVSVPPDTVPISPEVRRAAGTARGTGVMYNEPGRMVSVADDVAFFVFAAEQPRYDRYDLDAQRRVLADAYAGAGWEVPRVLDAALRAPDLYLDAISRVGIDRYTTGRVALVGDAAYGNTLGGFGTGLAMVGAYLLAGELAAADGDHRAAFARYEELMRPYARIARTGNAGPFLAPPTRARIRMRDWTFRSRLLLSLLLWLTDFFATDVELPDYAEHAAPGHAR